MRWKSQLRELREMAGETAQISMTWKAARQIAQPRVVRNDESSTKGVGR